MMKHALIAFLNCFRPTFTGREFRGRAVVLDNARFQSCRIDRCTIIYRGGKLWLCDNEIKNCTYQFEGAAASTVELMYALEKSGLHGVIKETFPKAFWGHVDERIRNS